MYRRTWERIRLHGFLKSSDRTPLGAFICWVFPKNLIATTKSRDNCSCIYFDRSERVVVSGYYSFLIKPLVLSLSDAEICESPCCFHFTHTFFIAESIREKSALQALPRCPQVPRFPREGRGGPSQLARRYIVREHRLEASSNTAPYDTQFCRGQFSAVSTPIYRVKAH